MRGQGGDVNGIRDLDADLDARALAPVQWRVMVLCTVVILLDGFDVQAIAFTGPAIAAQWGLASGSLGPVFAAGLVGMAVGALVVGPLGDRYGRRAAVQVSVFVFGLFTLLTAFAHNLESLIALRALTGIGLGGALPNATALMTEYAPARRRQLAVAVIFLGIPFGGMLGGVVANALVPRFGWQAVFVAGGLAPLVLVPVLYRLLPESVRFALLRPSSAAYAARLIRQLRLPGAAVDYARTGPAAASGGVRGLFADGRGVDTVLLWGVFFLNLMAVYFLISWIPTLLVQAGHGLARATQTSVLLNLGGAIGPLVLAALSARLGTRWPLLVWLAAAALSVGLLGQVGAHLGWVMVMTFLAGFFTFGAQISMNALAAGMYPTPARATGVGWALGVGRLGSILGPVIGGVLVGLALGFEVYFGLFAVLLVAAAVVCTAIRGHTPAMRSGAGIKSARVGAKQGP